LNLPSCVIRILLFFMQNSELCIGRTTSTVGSQPERRALGRTTLSPFSNQNNANQTALGFDTLAGRSSLPKQRFSCSWNSSTCYRTSLSD
jgi:hypothetical protein